MLPQAEERQGLAMKPAPPSLQLLAWLLLALFSGLATWSLTLGSQGYRLPLAFASTGGGTPLPRPAAAGAAGAGGAAPCSEAYVTLLTDEAYLPGTLALVWGLKKYQRGARAVVVMLPAGWRAGRPGVEAALVGLGASVAYVPHLANPYDAAIQRNSGHWDARFGSRGDTSVFMKVRGWVGGYCSWAGIACRGNDDTLCGLMNLMLRRAMWQPMYEGSIAIVCWPSKLRRRRRGRM